MKAEEYEDELRTVVFTYLSKPVAIAIGMIALGSIVDSILKTNTLFITIFVVVGMAGYLIKLIIPVNPINDLMDKTKARLRGKNLRHPDDYIYLDKERIGKYFAYYTKSDGIFVSSSHSSSAGVSGAISAPGASLGTNIGGSNNLNFEIVPERLFESIENELRKEFPKIESNEVFLSGKTGWISGKFLGVGHGNRSNSSTSYDVLHFEVFGKHILGFQFNPNYLSPGFKTAINSPMMRGFEGDVEILGDIVDITNMKSIIPICIIVKKSIA